MAFNKKVLSAAQPFPNTSIFGHDLWIGLVAECIGKVKFLNTPLVLYRRHNSSQTSISNNLFSTGDKFTVFLALLGGIAGVWSVIKYAISLDKGCFDK
jgi:hypothetical protein